MATAEVAIATTTITTSESGNGFKRSVTDWSVNDADSSVSSSLSGRISLLISSHTNLHRVGQRLLRIGARQGFRRVSRSVPPPSGVADVRISGCRVAWGAYEDKVILPGSLKHSARAVLRKG
jgi:hypothetical protein